MVIKTKLRESVNFRLDPKLLKAARNKAEKDGTSLTALVVQGLNIVLGIENSINLKFQLDDIVARVEQLESTVYSTSTRRKRVKQ